MFVHAGLKARQHYAIRRKNSTLLTGGVFLAITPVNVASLNVG